MWRNLPYNINNSLSEVNYKIDLLQKMLYDCMAHKWFMTDKLVIGSQAKKNFGYITVNFTLHTGLVTSQII